ncbi:MAG TPA: S-methyl-5-thioribose-1-phosphate isomerase [Gemmatimonadales bacterium]|nr:S-methyl-5-thioribose-1-phosphate isomerase [Gemmatimonadales bacterium]
MPVRTDAIAWAPSGAVRLLDQTLLPREVRYLDVDTIGALVEAIGSLRVRGAPLIGIAAAMGLAAAARCEARARLTPEWVADAVRRLAAARPTAVNLAWALERMQRAAARAFGRGSTGEQIVDALRAEAERIWDEDAAMCEAIARFGQDLIPSGASVLTICNTGMLATGGIGTAFGMIRTAHEQGRGIDVIACETRPLGQGSRLTMWELARVGIPARLIVDAAAASLMARGEVDLVVTGADRIAANGDTANKIGTYALAVLARAHNIPFYVAAPRSTVDLALASGDLIPIEERSAAEVTPVEGTPVYNPAFDVTPAELISAIVTDGGVALPPFVEDLRAHARQTASPEPPDLLGDAEAISSDEW